MHTESATAARTFAAKLGYPKTNADAIAAVADLLPEVTGEVVKLGAFQLEVAYAGPAGTFRVEHAESGVFPTEHAYAALFAAGIA